MKRVLYALLAALALAGGAVVTAAAVPGCSAHVKDT